MKSWRLSNDISTSCVLAEVNSGGKFVTFLFVFGKNGVPGRTIIAGGSGVLTSACKLYQESYLNFNENQCELEKS